MKFCIISNLYPPFSRGGAEKIVELIAQGLKKYGEVVLITSTPKKDNKENHNGLLIYRINPKNIYYILNDYKQGVFKKIFWHFKDLYCLKSAYKVKKILKEVNPDIVLTHNLKGLGFKIFEIIHNLKIKHIHTLHDYQLLDPHGSLYRQGKNVKLDNLFYRFYRRITKKRINKPQVVVSPSNFVLEKHKGYGFFTDSKTLAMPNPVIISPEITKMEIERLNLLYVGQIEEHKGINFLLEAFNKVEDKNITLDIVGDGSQFEKIKYLIGNDPRIKLHGHLNYDDVCDIYRRVDLLVVPSLWQENSPTVIYEAYQNSTPVLVSDAGGSKELVDEGKTGWIFKAGDVDSLADKISNLAKNHGQLIEMGRQARVKVKNYNLDSYLNKLLEICRNLNK